MGMSGAADEFVRLIQKQNPPKPLSAAGGVKKGCSREMIAGTSSGGEHNLLEQFTLKDRRRWQVNACRAIRLYADSFLPWLTRAGVLEADCIQAAFGDAPGLMTLFTDLIQEPIHASAESRDPDYSSSTWKRHYDAEPGRVTDEDLCDVFLGDGVSEAMGSRACLQLFGASAPRLELMAANTAKAEGWPELRSLSGPEPAEILTSDLPSVLGQIAAAIQSHSETPGALSVFCVLGVLATAVQRKFRVKLCGEHHETLSLYLLCGLAPGERKSAVLEIVRQPLTTWEIDKRIELAPTIQELTEEAEILKARISQLRSRAAKTDDVNERQQLLEEIRECQSEIPVIPANPTLTSGDVTAEALAVQMQRQGERLAILSDEGGIFETIAGRYSRGVPNCDLYLQSFSGSSVRISRASKDEVTLRSPALTMLLTVQPQVIQEAISNEVFRGRGLVQRFLFAMPVSRLGFRSLEPVAIPESISGKWQSIVTRLLNEVQHEDDNGGLVARIITLSPEAAVVWRKFQREMEVAMRPGGEWDFETGWCSKAPGAIGRLAAVIHSGLCAARGRSPDDVPVDASIMTAAVSLGRKIAEHSRVAFRGAGVDRGLRLANKVASWLERERPESFSSRDLQRQVCGGDRLDERELAGAIEELQEAGWIRPVESPPSERGGRPSRRWAVHPVIVTCGLRRIADNTDETQEHEGGGEVLSVVSAGAASVDDGEVEPEEVLSVVSECSAMSGVRGVNTGLLDTEAIQWAENACSGGSR